MESNNDDNDDVIDTEESGDENNEEDNDDENNDDENNDEDNVYEYNDEDSSDYTDYEDDLYEEDESEDDPKDDEEYDNEYKSSDYPALYENSTMSLNEAVFKIVDLWIDQKLSKVYLKKHLELMSDMLPRGNLLPKTPYMFFKYIKEQVPVVPIIHHYYCENCLIYLSSNYQICSQCNGGTISNFFELDLKEQIKQLFEIKNLAKRLQSVSDNEEYISDITDGTEYKRVNNRKDRNPFDLTLMLYTDGLSLAKSAKSHCWPLMFTIAELPPNIRHFYIVTFGLWCNRKTKPPMNLFLQPFCNKLRECFTDGIEWTDPLSGLKTTSKITAPLFIADAPARAQIQNILSFNGKYGCNLCEIKSKQCVKPKAKRLIRIYPFQSILKIRSRNSMKIQADAVRVIKGVKGHSIITILPKLDISTCVLPEYMHSVLLGVVKQFINIWINKKGPWQIKKHILDIDKFLLQIKPTEHFARHPRSLTNFQIFKATEFFNFLIYYSIPTLHSFLPETYFQHWMLLVISIYNMLKNRIHISTDIQQADQLLKKFVESIKELYGEHELTYNIHQLLHLVFSVQRWGPLWATSAFMFESQNGFLANNVHGKNKMGQELLNNLQIIEAVDALKYICKYKSTNRVNAKFKVLGKSLNYIFNHDEILLLSSRQIDFSRGKVFSRAEINNELYTSMLYKETKKNNYTVMVKTNVLECFGCIQFFILTENNKLNLVLKKFDIDEKRYFTHLETESVVEHIIPVQDNTRIFIFEVENIKNIKHVVRVGSFICLKPNVYNLEF